MYTQYMCLLYCILKTEVMAWTYSSLHSPIHLHSSVTFAASGFALTPTTVHGVVCRIN